MAHITCKLLKLVRDKWRTLPVNYLYLSEVDGTTVHYLYLSEINGVLVNYLYLSEVIGAPYP